MTMLRSTASPYAVRKHVLGALARVPPFTRPESREATLREIRSLRRARRRLFEHYGSPRYSRPALHDIDAKLARHLPYAEGVFVEVGAYDGYRYSNTYYLERFRHWSGVLIEPIPDCFQQCLKDRPRSQVFQCALVADDGPDTLAMTYGGPTSARADAELPQKPPTFGWERAYEVTVLARSLTSVLMEAGIARIDFMSIDVEGFELDVLRGLDLERFAPQCMLIETNGAQSAIERALSPRFDLIDHFSPNDAFFRRRLENT